MTGIRAALARRWPTIVIFMLLGPFLFMLFDMAFEQMSQDPGLTLARLGNWIAEDVFFVPRFVFMLGALPAAVVGALVAWRDSRGLASGRWIGGLSAGFGIVIGIFFARNLFIFTPPPLGAQLAIGARAFVSVVLAGFLCYGLSRPFARPLLSQEER
ncbi:hypothetical protein [Kaistia sp. MMO-174]|uniref:hypothetical protein n=1 Tax=Kaistia sp. MMO-174 TaxID=3081256 RepID=UPI001AD0B6DB|nr:hypothetical protein [Hyphomicrobiales bacterium]MBN9058101.1 hypothetical protein [Hyphomicrobiales bacterium]